MTVRPSHACLFPPAPRLRCRRGRIGKATSAGTANLTFSAGAAKPDVPVRLALCIVSVSCMLAQPGTARAETLREAIAAALAHNPTLAAADAGVRAADEARNRAQGAYGPSLSLTVSHNYTYETDLAPGYRQTQDGFATDGALTLTQPLFTFGRLAAANWAARAAQGYAREQRRATRQSLLLSVITAYAAVRRDLELYNVAQENRALLTRQRNMIEQRFELRDATAPDLEQTSAQLALAQGRLLDARAAVEQSAARFRNLVGHYPLDVTALPDLPPLPGSAVLESRAARDSPELGAARYLEAQAAAALAAARAETGPNISAQVSAERTPYTPYANASRANALVAGVTLTMPLHSGGQLSASVREAQARDQAAKLQIEQSWRDMREALAANIANARAARARLPIYRKAVRNAQSAVTGIQEQERAGIRTVRELLDATSDLLNARTLLAQAEADSITTYAGALRAAGDLSEDTLFPASANADGSGPNDNPASEPGTVSRQPVTRPMSGLPLRPVIAPLDRAFMSTHAAPVDIQHEDDARFVWPDSAVPPAPEPDNAPPQTALPGDTGSSSGSDAQNNSTAK